MLARLRRVWHTVRYLRASQLVAWIWRRGVQPRLQSRPAVLSRASAPAHASPISFRFLNCERAFRAGEFSWQPEGQSRLWVYHLHYFDWLRDDARDASVDANLIDHWIHANPQARGPGWEPYPLSLRVVNWCRWLLDNKQVAPAGMLDSLVAQANWLARNHETHILANHYFENLKALLFAGAIVPHSSALR